MEKSFIIQAKGLEEALDKAAIVLHCEKERIAYELLREPTVARRGLRGQSCKLRVTPVAPSAEEIRPDTEQDRIWNVIVPLSESDLASLPPSDFLTALNEAIAADLAAEAWITPIPEAEYPIVGRNIVGNLSASAGPIDHIGDLHVFGTVQKGAHVKATGAINIDGGVETAFVDAGSDIRIGEGLLGTVRSSAGNIHCRFAQGANLEAPDGNIIVRESAMHSQIHAGKNVEIGDILLGGSCYGEMLVQTHTAGSESGVVTHLWSGKNRQLYAEIEQIRDRTLESVARITACTAIERELLPSEEVGQPCGQENRVRLCEAMLRKARIAADLSRLSREKSVLLGMINSERGSRICIVDRAYPNVKISIDNSGVDIQKLTQFATFSRDYDLGELRLTPYN